MKVARLGLWKYPDYNIQYYVIREEREWTPPPKYYKYKWQTTISEEDLQQTCLVVVYLDSKFVKL